ncbi:PLD nuclease N-terminal domain-containing protein [Rhodospirillum rubrum]|uniref:Cardiolipin synthase N-terminal domain-containing protein n=1 Tax=Rhodospirillum rubrum (strain ATCC 11170 / ATH 1.1.1 / DSM 467 / LMG 4362 / NCIMB 8255 / S1) TaxID=269796 RepID=Q2RP59_RHORT|nr:PLD nuclease N-terminal domain-containing protein [Rhodospirillum rubrum]ABC24086.1 conserved hypothetical protein [Rhodospirillum rubrum ATCC 11170]AEO49832.1 hypothetical protein F11_16860 [Rhodospirillum rubrum F11]MBK1666207.1 hypothetical protein [Rhodospirillum rubrum]MBK1678188.1 hypothetical protein [Rhodospirillum rubrum]MBK5955771.1 hypothetical protein [Rhodospirillum rubrum]
MSIEVGGFFGFVLLICDIWAAINVINSPTTSTGGKVVWVVAILLMPVLGFLAWLFAGPRSAR